MKIVVILGSGIGNSILFSPTLVALRRGLPDARIDVLAHKASFAEPFTGTGLVDKCYVFDGLGSALKLRREKYDVSIAAFPSNKWQFNVFAFLVGAKRRMTHSYNVGGMSALSFLQNETVPANESLHDVDQNLALLSLLGIQQPADKELVFHVGDAAGRWRRAFMEKNNLVGRHLIGVHPGSGPLAYKRAPVKKFVECIEENARDDSVALIFGTPDEADVKKLFPGALSLDSILVEDSLKNVGALIKECDLFVTNDTGLMHIASTSPKTHIIAFFNGTNPTRTRPYSDNADVVILRGSMLKYPFSSTKAKVGK